MKNTFSKLGKARRFLHQPPVSGLLAGSVAFTGVILGLVMILNPTVWLEAEPFREPMRVVVPQIWGLLFGIFGALVGATALNKKKKHLTRLFALLYGLTAVAFSGNTFWYVAQGGLPSDLIMYMFMGVVSFITMISFMEVHHDQAPDNHI